MKVMFYSPLSLRYGGGGERYILELVRHLKGHNVSCVVVCSASIAGEKERIPIERIHAILDQVSAEYYELACSPLPLFSRNSSIPRLREIKRLMKLARDCDIIYFNSGHVVHDLVMLAVRNILGKPVVSAHHCPLYFREKLHDLYVDTIGKKVMRKLDGHHVLNPYFLHFFESWGLRNVYLIPNGVDTEKFQPRNLMKKQERLRILFVGRLTPAKGIDVLCESIKMLNGNKAFQENVAFVIAGSGPMEPMVRRLSEQYPNVTYLGYLEESLPKVYRNCDLLVMLSRRETFPLVLLEAQASGLPVIAFDITGPRDILIDGVTGTLIPKKDLGMLTREITHYYSIWLNNYEKYKRMGLAARRNVKERFDWSIIAGRIHDMLRETLRQKNSRL
jgi:glycosyltransferase involved in cell wall biosynthesis